MLVSLRAVCLASVLALCACGSSSNAPVEGTIYASCTNVDTSSTCAAPAPGFANDVLPIIEKSCFTNCHDGSSADIWPLTDYDDTKAWSNFIAPDIAGCTMPPIENAAQYPITRQDRETILQWIACGTPQ